ncbi:MAG TPA: hypothetical protein VHA13_03135, partial [Gammaproteobacteria bacterium]|nr:hypothetical protein [Gammaproteobacteria bacterium]
MSKHLTPPADQWKEQLISGFSPNKGQTYYPGIAPGLYIFVQDLKTKKIFLMANPEGRGHPLLTNLINESQSLTKGDFRIGLAGEMLIGAEGEILGYTFQTGYFHQQLGLTEPDAGHPSYLDYMARLATILETALLPPSRHFNVKAWGEIFNKKNRESLF